jgi:hypothetical protein
MNTDKRNQDQHPCSSVCIRGFKSSQALPQVAVARRQQVFHDKAFAPYAA